ncbi:MAG: chemotaxis protein CheD [Clostridiales bacterium]|jgi:chemotaxis protein CheD|nr:chemotaxis protein CheD [Clostridiales bacterium]
MNDFIRVKIADLAVSKNDGVIITVGLGSCVGIALYDPAVKAAGLAHILLADSTMFKNQSNPAKFADTAIPLLVQQMVHLGARPSRLQAKIAGGSQLFSFENSLISVGEKNIRMVRSVLESLRIPVIGEDLGGSVGRTMKLFVPDGKVLISTVGTGEKQL